MKKIVIPGVIFENDYYITTDGKVYSEWSQKFLKPDISRGYSRVTLFARENGKSVRKRYLVHRLVLLMYNPIDNWQELEVNHIDFNSRNNSLNNLEWTTRLENHRHSKKAGRLKWTEEQKMNVRALTKQQAQEVVDLLMENKLNIPQIAKKFNVCVETISKINRRIDWTELTDKVILPLRAGRKRLNEKQVLEIIDLLLEGKTQVYIASLYNVAPNTIGAIKNKVNWKHLTKNITFE